MLICPNDHVLRINLTLIYESNNNIKKLSSKKIIVIITCHI